MKAELDIDISILAEVIAREVVKAVRSLNQQQVKHEDDALCTVQSLAKYLEVSPQWVYERINRKEIPFIKMGKFPRFRKSDIDRWLDSQKVPVTQTQPKHLKLVR
jgi:excisionase family DNA binding protein